LALEKTFKVLLHQRGIQDLKDFGHDMKMLREAAESVGIGIEKRKTEKLPHWKVAASRRYGESILNPSEAFIIYQAILEIMYDLIKHVKQTIVISDAEFLLKKAPWV